MERFEYVFNVGYVFFVVFEILRLVIKKMILFVWGEKYIEVCEEIKFRRNILCFVKFWKRINLVVLREDFLLGSKKVK